jgi:hypothetical protein
MMRSTLVSGAWQLRHGEPVAAEETWLTLSLHREIDLENRLLYVDTGTFADTDRSGSIPLAVLAGSDERAEIAYLVHSLDADCALFMRVGEAPQPELGLAQRIAKLFEDWHLRLNNNECYYSEGCTAAVVFELRGSSPYWALGEALYEVLDEGRWPLFRPQFRVPPRSWHHQVDAYTADPAGASPESLVVASEYARHRRSWDQRIVTAQLLRRDAGGEWISERRAEIAIENGDQAEALTAFAGGPVRHLKSWHKLASEVPCESLRSGNVFKISIEDARPLAGQGPGRLVARIQYEKTRGAADRSAIAEDLQSLSRHLTDRLAEEGTSATRGEDMLSKIARIAEAAA